MSGGCVAHRSSILFTTLSTGMESSATPVSLTCLLNIPDPGDRYQYRFVVFLYPFHGNCRREPAHILW
jgi:hypothetical protein